MPEKALNNVVSFTSSIWKVGSAVVALIGLIASGVIAYEQIHRNKADVQTLNERVTKQYSRHSESIELLEKKIEELERELEAHKVEYYYTKGKLESK